MRRFEKLPEKTKISILFILINCGLDDPIKETKKENFYSLASQYGKSYGIKESDFDIIKNKTIQEIINILY